MKFGKYKNGYFDEALVEGAIAMIQRWKPQPFPVVVTCVPSLRHPELVPNFAQRLALKLGIPFVSCVRKLRHTPQQKTMHNSYQQAHNLEGAFAVAPCKEIDGKPVFLVDDMVDSGWTFTVIAALLRQAGSGEVFPLALAVHSLGEG